MQEGWYQDDYLVLFDDSEVRSASERYDIIQLLPGYKVIGLRGWDDFIVQDSNGRTYTVPTLPVIPDYVEPYRAPPEGTVLTPDERFHNRIKWYVKPIVFGGDPKVEGNVTWVSHEQHAQLVKWWHGIYRSVKTQGP
jgi:hypothetical protein